jgi:hypothetical protein
LYPEYQILVDGRQAWVHGSQFMRRYYASEKDPEALRALADELGLTWAVTRATEGEMLTPALARSPEWVMTFWNGTSAVYVRRGGPNHHLAQDGYRVLRHLAQPADVLQAALRRGPTADALAHDGALALAQDPTSARAAFMAACGAIASNDAPGFSVALAALVRLAPGHPSVAVLRRAWSAGNQDR